MIPSFSKLFVPLAIFLLLDNALGATTSDWRSRSIYQVFTDRFARTDGSNTYCAPGYGGFCGGTWQGIINKLDYIQDMGFTAVWISPVVEQVADQARAYHGYSATNIYGLNGNFGSASELKALSKALHDRGMYFMVDVVANHMAWDGKSDNVDYSKLTPFNKKEDFHVNPICFISNYENQQEVEECWLGNNDYPLPDLNTKTENVRNMFSEWVSWFVDEYSIDGLRIDTVKHVEKSFWPGFNTASKVFNLGEVASGDISYLCDYQNYMDGLLNYGAYYQITQFFSNPQATSSNLVNAIDALGTNCKDVSVLGSFTENHDQGRFANLTGDMMLAKNAIVYTMLADGIPIIYQGQEHHFSGSADPYDREALWPTNYDTTGPLYQVVKQLNAIRSLALAKSTNYLTTRQKVVYSDDHVVAISKGEPTAAMTLMVLTNLGEKATQKRFKIENVGFERGLKIVELFSCIEAVVDDSGGLEVVQSGEALVYYPNSLLPGTGWCGR
ncbi:hypothetical protein HYFRA_00001838 [Hymenoscyphus fraxineus]|uniref:alpha-amylase n=1 Tax=Hymenoscyphus fraxineus TaxID=746836 RepID=A0A9N9KNH8_9HELO|nr:hypothetical protein HYFRA_00001838 [Hymenoscyphus fraxineus]